MEASGTAKTLDHVLAVPEASIWDPVRVQTRGWPTGSTRQLQTKFEYVIAALNTPVRLGSCLRRCWICWISRGLRTYWTDRFLLSVTLLRFRNSVGPTSWTLLGRLTVTVPCGTWYRVRGTLFVCIITSLLTSIACMQFLIIASARAFTLSVTEVHWLWDSSFSVVSEDDGNSNSRYLVSR